MISPTGDGFDARVAELERFLDELDRRTYSNFTVTNPTTGVRNLEVGPVGAGFQVTVRDSNGNTIFGNRPDIGFRGFRMPMPMYPAVPYGGGLTATTTTWVTMWHMQTFVNSTEVQVSYRFGDTSPAGGTTETRVAYDSGSGLTVMTGSDSSGVNPTNSTKQFAFVWPTDLYDTEVQVFFQARMGTGTGAALISPMWCLGG